MTVLLVSALTLVALAGTAVVATNIPERQAVTLSLFGLALTVLFVAFQAPDVALSQLGVGAAIVPLMVMLAIRTTRGRHARQRDDSGPDDQGQEPTDVLPGRGDGHST
jgi:energy-converting hydrogenase B subunit D